MKKSLREQIERIHTLTYGKKVIKEGFLDDLLGREVDEQSAQKIDDPKLADKVGTDSQGNKIADPKLVEDFFNTLQTAITNGGLSQQNAGSMNYQKEVESMQIGLMLLGYDLPRHGVDGLFGPETASAVEKFISDNKVQGKPLSEASEELRSTLSQLGYDEKASEISSGGEITDQLSAIVSKILKDFKAGYPNVKVTVTGGNDKFHQGLSYKSKHTEGQAVDLVIDPFNNQNADAFVDILNRYKSQDGKFSYIDEYRHPSGAATAGHFHLQYGEGTAQGGPSTRQMVVATPEVLTKMVELLKAKNITPQQLKEFMDKYTTLTGGGAEFTDLDLTTKDGVQKYAEICQKYIDSRQPNPLGVTGNMMATAAVKAFEKYHKFVPAELALAQMVAEGGLGNGDMNSRPIRTKNPYNVGNVDSGANVYETSVENGIQRYYDLIAKNYIGNGKTAKDLITNFVNKDGERYASGTDYEQSVASLAGQAHKVAMRVAPDNQPLATAAE